jgi:hypothetical protein
LKKLIFRKKKISKVKRNKRNLIKIIINKNKIKNNNKEIKIQKILPFILLILRRMKSKKNKLKFKIQNKKILFNKIFKAQKKNLQKILNFY